MNSTIENLKTRLLIGLACISILISVQGGWAAMVKGPYLIFPGDNTRMEVCWQLGTTAPCTLEWGTDPSCAGGRISSAEYDPASHQHKQVITGLTPGKKYFYRVKEGADGYAGSFRAAPAAGATSLKFLAYGDTRTQDKIDNAVSEAMQKTYGADPAYQTFALHMGDWVSSDSESAWTSEFFVRSDRGIMGLLANLPIQGCMGNHEQAGVVYRKYWPYPYKNSRFYWSFDYGPAHVVVVDQYDESVPNGLGTGPSAAQLDWVRKDLAATKKPWKFMVYHEPAWTVKNGIHGDNARAQAVLQPLCKQYGVDLCFCGHVHLYARCIQDGVQHVTLGGGGAPLFSLNAQQPANVAKVAVDYQYARIEINGPQLTFTALKPDGTVLDTFTIKHPVKRDDRVKKEAVLN